MPLRRQLRLLRIKYLPLVTALVLWLVSVTAFCHSVESALAALAGRSDLALTLLRLQLGDFPRDDGLPTAVSLVISQSPLLLSGREAVLELRGRAETDRSDPIDQPSPSPADESIPIEEVPQEPDTPLVIADNGVSAKTLVPSSQKGYVITGDVYIDNRSDKIFDETLFDGSFAARLTADDSQPRVLIVHTHGSEAYTMPPGEEYVPCGDFRTTDEDYSVVRVGEEIASVLRGAGISVLHAVSLHDYPEYSGAYDRSLATIEEYLARYPSISLVLDVHRDAVSDSEGNMYKVVSSVAGVNAAQMAFVIGTDGGGLAHPAWQENLKLAAAIQQTLCDVSPTLMRPITVRNSRYNQHTTTGSLLVEMGAAGNSLEEALFSARLLGQAIVDTMLSGDTSSPPDRMAAE